MASMIDLIIHEATKMLQCSEVMLYITEKHKRQLKFQTKNYRNLKDLNELDEPFKLVIEQGKSLKIPASEEGKSALYVPVLDENKNTIAVIFAFDKMSSEIFTEKDEAALKALSSHISKDLEMLDKIGQVEADLLDTLERLRSNKDISNLEIQIKG
mmetsp:Transcript_17403/g.25806  ORF Transcript_17403/g.25806 Transcript_17403/m.25806 type:complete len:156 (-) Transcript_17403:184-651(-)|eukprot:CAMPEP_0171458584 /NCGR_PEP_ID=MMETSP0945-20130129/4204_1 /TAXON_ID=109269 /ORGANISM="Vaucheria litorea, Strain CCMP2940" /LENGTH=155 /DNA_ID=CAMNT_0011984421 /DNA_START=56 /DNA_END=523 /DNA_ORIENTATION=+